MQRVLSFPNMRSSSGESGEFVTKRLCCSTLFSIAFLSVIAGFLLGRFSFDQELALTRKLVRNNSSIPCSSTRQLNEGFNGTYFQHPFHVEDLQKHRRSLELQNSSNNSLLQAQNLHNFLHGLGFELVTSLKPTFVSIAYPNPSLPNQVSINDASGTPLRIFMDNRTAYSIKGEVETSKTLNNHQGEPVYVNFGRDEDYLYLDSIGITVAGHIVLARAGGAPTSEIVLTALNHDAVGVLMYTDPAQEGLIPRQLLSPADQAQLHDQYLSTLTGVAEVNVSAPVLLISTSDAFHILQFMSAKEQSPTNWRGDLKCSYPIGPGFSDPDWSMHLTLNTIHVTQPHYDVIAAIRGSHEPDRVVLLGASLEDESLVGAATLKEVSYHLAALSNDGWKPYRSVALAFWGQREKRQASLVPEVVAYFDLDVDGQNLDDGAADDTEIHGSLLLSSLFDKTKTIFSVPLFLQFVVPTAGNDHLVSSAVPFMKAEISKKTEAWEIVGNLGALWGNMATQLSTSAVLPISLEPYISFFNETISVLNQRFHVVAKRHKLFLETLTETVQNLTSAISNFQKRWTTQTEDPLALRRITDQISSFSSALSCSQQKDSPSILLTRHPIFSASETSSNATKAGLGELQDLLRAMTSTDAPSDLQRRIVTLVTDIIRCLNNATYSLSDRLDRLLLWNT